MQFRHAIVNLAPTTRFIMLRNYKVLKGTASALALDDDNDPHIEIRLEAGDVSYRIAMNVRSKESPHDLLYANVMDFQHAELTAELAALPMGLTDIRGDRQDLAIDYVRGGIIEREDMDVAPFSSTDRRTTCAISSNPSYRKASPTSPSISTPSVKPGDLRTTSRTNISDSNPATASTTST